MNLSLLLLDVVVVVVVVGCFKGREGGMDVVRGSVPHVSEEYLTTSLPQRVPEEYPTTSLPTAATGCVGMSRGGEGGMRLPFFPRETPAASVADRTDVNRPEERREGHCREKRWEDDQPSRRRTSYKTSGNDDASIACSTPNSGTSPGSAERTQQKKNRKKESKAKQDAAPHLVVWVQPP